MDFTVSIKWSAHPRCARSGYSHTCESSSNGEYHAAAVYTADTYVEAARQRVAILVEPLRHDSVWVKASPADPGQYFDIVQSANTGEPTVRPAVRGG